MARTPMVTRTIQTTKANVLCLNIVDGEPFNKVVTLPRTYKDENAMLKVISKMVDNDEVKAVHVVDSYVEETLYGMSEQRFIDLAQVMPPHNAAKADD